MFLTLKDVMKKCNLKDDTMTESELEKVYIFLSTLKILKYQLLKDC